MSAAGIEVGAGRDPQDAADAPDAARAAAPSDPKIASRAAAGGVGAVLGTLLWGAWSLLGWPLAFGWMAAIVLCSIPVTWFVPFWRFQHRFPARMMGMTPWVSFSPLRVSYDPGFDPTRPSVFIQNHVSMLDGHVDLGSIPGRFCGVENAAHFRIPFYGWLMRHGGGIPIRRGQKGQLAILVEAARERVDRGYSILAFPEGHRTRDGRLGPFRRGAFTMARELGLPIVPLAVRGLDRVLPKGTWILRPSTIEVRVGPQLETAGLDDAGLDALIETTRGHLQAWLERREPAG